MNYVMQQWQRWRGHALGRWLFTRMIGFRAPYFHSIHARFELLEAWQARVHVPHRRSVTNHIGTVHAIAMTNACELAAGVMMEASLPAALRWIPKAMQVQYLLKADGGIRAQAHCHPVSQMGSGDVEVYCEVRDAREQLVMKAVITMYVSPRTRRT